MVTNRVNTKTVILQFATKIMYSSVKWVNYELSLLFDGFLAFLSKLRSNLFPLIQYNFYILDTLPVIYITYASLCIYFLKETKL